MSVAWMDATLCLVYELFSHATWWQPSVSAYELSPMKLPAFVFNGAPKCDFFIIYFYCPIICAEFPHLRPKPGLILHRGPAPRGPSLRRRRQIRDTTSVSVSGGLPFEGDTAAESLRWCSVVPVLIEHTQDTTNCSPSWGQCVSDVCVCMFCFMFAEWSILWVDLTKGLYMRRLEVKGYKYSGIYNLRLSHGVRLSERPSQRADRRYVTPPILLCGLSDAEGFDQNCLRQGRREEHRGWGHHESMALRATEAET